MDDLSKKLKDFGQQSVSVSGSLLDGLGLEPKSVDQEPTVPTPDQPEELSMEVPSKETPTEVIEEASRDEILGVGTRVQPGSEVSEPEGTQKVDEEVTPDEDISSPFDDVESEVSPPEPTVQEKPKEESVAPPRTDESLNQSERQLVQAIMLGSKTLLPQEVEVQTEGVAKVMIDGL